MLSYPTILAFSGLNLTLCLIPSPEMSYVLSQSSLQGRVAGMVFVAGVCSALAIQVLVMAVGISTLIQSTPWVFLVLKAIGIGYLVYLAWQVFKQPINTINTTPQGENLGRLFRKGVAINLTNPMNPLFLLLVFPAFISPNQGSVFSQSLQLGLLLIIIVFTVFSLISVAGEVMAKQLLHSEQSQRYLQRGAAITIVCFAIILLLAEQPV